MSDKVKIARFAVHALGSFGVAKVVNDIIANNTTIQTTADAVKVWSGSIVIGSMVADQASKHVTAKMDAVQNWWEHRNDEEEVAPV